MSSLKDAKKFGDLGFNHWMVLPGKFPEFEGMSNLDIFKGIVSGEIEISLNKKLKARFDRNGRRIFNSWEAAIDDSNYQMAKNDCNWFPACEWFKLAYGIDFPMSKEEFYMQVDKLCSEISMCKFSANILNGPFKPLLIPQGHDVQSLVNFDDLAVEHDMIVSPKLKASLENAQVAVHCSSRLDELQSRLQKGPVIALFFISPLAGYSVGAQREQMNDNEDSLPNGFVLPGLETLLYIIAYKDWVCMDDTDSRVCGNLDPNLCLSGLQFTQGEGENVNEFNVSVSYSDDHAHLDLIPEPYFFSTYKPKVAGSLLYIGKE